MTNETYKSCTLCMRNCAKDRERSLGFCKMPATPYVTRAARHMWEEPVISGTRGSGTIFFSGCSLGCVFCQNREISRSVAGEKTDAQRLSQIMLRLQQSGAHNINFVTPTHYAPTVREAVLLSRKAGLSVPIVYNTGGFDTPETIRSLSGIVDVYLPDYKFYTAKSAKKYANAPAYPDNIRKIIAEMVTETGVPVLNTEGVLEKGVVVRILLLPGHVAEAKLTVKYLYETYGNGIFFSLMSQYTPMPDMPSPLSRRVTKQEYRELVDYAERLGVTNAFVQDESSASEIYIPSFDGSGVSLIES